MYRTQIDLLKLARQGRIAMPIKPVSRRPPPLSRGRGTASIRVLAAREAER